MRRARRLSQAVGVLAVSTGVIGGAAPAATADNELGHLVFVVKDQGGGAYGNVLTGERFDVTASSIGTSLARAGVQAATGLVLTESGQILAPVDSALYQTPAAAVVQVVQDTVLGTYQDAADGTLYAIKTVGQTVPEGNELALHLATNVILTINNKVLIPVQKKTGLDQH